MKVIASHNPNDDIRMHSSAGGVFTLLAESIIEYGGVVYGAAFDAEWNVAHQRVDNITDLAKLRGSKYVYSKFTSAISEAIKDLNDGRKVLFSGTPCQVAAMKKRAGENENLLLVEVICHAAPEARFWEQYLDEVCATINHSKSEIESISFRDKRTGWANYSFTIVFKDGSVFTQPHGENLYMRAFLNHYSIRRACMKCPFKYPNGSRADITIGDFWRIRQLAPDLDNDLGTTIIVVRIEKGKRMIESLKCLREFKFDDIAHHNPALVKAPSLPADRQYFDDEVLSGKPIIPLFQKYAGLNFAYRVKSFLRRIKRLLK